MIVPLSELTALLDDGPKSYLSPDFGRMTFYRARTGRVSPAKAIVFLALVRQRRPDILGTRLADGSVLFAPEAVAAIEDLSRRVANLEREVAALRSRRFRELCSEGRARLAGLTSSFD